MGYIRPEQLPKITDLEEPGTEIYVIQFQKDKGLASKYCTIKEYQDMINISKLTDKYEGNNG